jgi:MFS superfamily sulfate permease-like transporter
LGIAIASGAPPAAGLITGIIGGLVAGAFSGCPLQVSGPAAGLAVIVYEIVQTHGMKGLAIVVLFAGLIQIAAGTLRLGQYFRAISPSVVYGMLAGIGVLIFAAQFHVMVDDKPRQNGLASLLSIPGAIYKGVVPMDTSTHHLAAAIGLLTISILILWAKFAPAKLRWVPGALVAVMAATAASAIFSLPIKRVQLSDQLISGIEWMNWTALTSAPLGDLLPLALTVAFVASAETLLSAAAVDQMQNGPRTQHDRELIAQGLGNTLCGLAGSLPMTGVIVRSATNVAAGAKTRMSTIFHGLWLLVFVAALPSVLRLVPTAALAAVLVYTGYKLVNVQNIKRLLRYGGAPVAIYAATLIGIVATDMLTGILIGLGLSVLQLVYARTHFHIRVESHPELLRNDIYLVGAATFLRLPKLADTLEAVPPGRTNYIHFTKLDYVDDAALEVLANWQKQLGDKASTVVLEWEEALKLYRERNPLGQFQRADIPATTAAH